MTTLRKRKRKLKIGIRAIVQTKIENLSLKKIIYFEDRTETDAETGKTHSHSFDTKPKKVKFNDSSLSSTSKQNLALAKTITDEFICPLNFSTIAPFDVGKVSILGSGKIDYFRYELD